MSGKQAIATKGGVGTLRNGYGRNNHDREVAFEFLRLALSRRWIGRNRRLAKDFEATIDSARAFLYAASVMLLVRRLARAS